MVLGRFLNHSCDANLGVQDNQLGAYDFVALKEISDGTELNTDYETFEFINFKDGRGEEDFPLKCLCGDLECRGQVRGFKFNEQLLKERYGAFIAGYLKTEK